MTRILYLRKDPWCFA